MEDSLLQKIQKLRDRNFSLREIEAELGIPKSTVGYHLQKLSPDSRLVRGAIFGDYHYPFHDEKAIELMFKVLTDFKPAVIIINGDGGDFYECSKFEKNPALRSAAALTSEIAGHRQMLYTFRAAFPKADIKYIAGNHDYRWYSYINSNAKALHGLRGLSLPEQLDFGPLNIEFIFSGNRESSFLMGKMLIGHFDRVSMHSAYTAKALVDVKGISIVQNHVHRGGVFYKRVYDKTLVGYENFCLCDLNPPYTDRPNWQQGFSLFYKDKDSDLFHVDQYPIIHSDGLYKTIYNNSVYEV